MLKMSVGVNLKFISWNCRGLQKLKKVKQVMNKIKDLDSKIVFLQETHLLNEEDKRVRRRWQGSVFTAPFSSRARGVMTLIHNTVPFQVKNVIRDKMGRYLIVQGSLLSENLNLVNLYGPNIDDAKFFEDLTLTLSTFAGQYIIAGDFNSMLNPSMDRSTGQDQSHNRCRTVIHQFIKDLSLLDIRRELKPQEKSFSCYSSVFQTYSRINYFFISSDLRSKINKITL